MCVGYHTDEPGNEEEFKEIYAILVSSDSDDSLGFEAGFNAQFSKEDCDQKKLKELVKKYVISDSFDRIEQN